MAFGAGINLGPTISFATTYDSVPLPVSSSVLPSLSSSSSAKKSKPDTQSNRPTSDVTSAGNDDMGADTAAGGGGLDDLDFLLSENAEDFLGLGLDFDLDNH